MQFENKKVFETFLHSSLSSLRWTKIVAAILLRSTFTYEWNIAVELYNQGDQMFK